MCTKFFGFGHKAILIISLATTLIHQATFATGENMLDQPESKTAPAAEDTGRNMLHEDAMKSLGQKAGESLNESAKATNTSLQQSEQQILSALNGQTGKPAMCVPEDTNQLVVVTSQNWDAPTAQLQVFERDAQKGANWHSAKGLSWPVNMGYAGMGWGAGGEIKTPELIINGQLERTGGPVENADGSLDLSGHVTREGLARSVAGLFRIGVAWGTSLEAPEGSSVNYLLIDQFYRVIPQNGANLSDQQGHSLNGQTIRKLDPKDGSYERYEQKSGHYVAGTLAPDVMQSILKDGNIPEYHLVNQYVRDTAGNVLTGFLVKMNYSEIPKGENDLPVFGKNLRVPYTSLDPKTGSAGPSGTLDGGGTSKVYRESDYRWGDQPDQGHAVLSWDKEGKPILAKENDNLYNMPLRVIDRAAGEYERLDPDTGKPVHLGFLAPEKMQNLLNNEENMTEEVYKQAMDIRQNAHQQRDRGSAFFIHDENKNVEQGRPSGTAGCTSMSEAHLKLLMQRLQPNAMILQCPLYEIGTVVEALKPSSAI